jgi:hypothetical protein
MRMRQRGRMEGRDGSTRPVDASTSRALFVRRAVLFGGAALGGAAAAASEPWGALSAPSPAADTRILNFALGLERLQAEFYRQAVGRGGLAPELLDFATDAVEQERAHVAFLERELGGRAAAKPTFPDDLAPHGSRAFARLALALEENATAAYIGQGPRLSHGVVVKFVTLVSVEARQAAWIRDLVGVTPAPEAADASKTEAEVIAGLRSVGLRLPA